MRARKAQWPWNEQDKARLLQAAAFLCVGAGCVTAVGTTLTFVHVALGVFTMGLGLSALMAGGAWVLFDLSRASVLDDIAFDETTEDEDSLGNFDEIPMPVTTQESFAEVTDVTVLVRPDARGGLERAERLVDELEAKQRLGERVEGELDEVRQVVARVYAQRALCDVMPSDEHTRALRDALTELHMFLAMRKVTPRVQKGRVPARRRRKSEFGATGPVIVQTR